jgi:hypothetical protein
MAGLRWEARHARLPQRATLARLVLAHRLSPRDPLAASADELDADCGLLLN